MSQNLTSIDISEDTPSLVDLIADVERTHRPRIIRRSNEIVAVISPVRRALRRSLSKKKTQADIEAMQSAVGGWKDVDTDKLKTDIYEDRRFSTKPRLNL